jgi:hypothetical protein
VSPAGHSVALAAAWAAEAAAARQLQVRSRKAITGSKSVGLKNTASPLCLYPQLGRALGHRRLGPGPPSLSESPSQQVPAAAAATGGSPAGAGRRWRPPPVTDSSELSECQCDRGTQNSNLNFSGCYGETRRVPLAEGPRIFPARSVRRRPFEQI